MSGSAVQALALETEQKMESARAELAQILASKTFEDSPRLRQFLSYVVTEALDGRGSRIKGYTIAYDVFGRNDPEDAQVSAIVRVEAGRLRRHLDDYYAGEGQRSGVRISVPKGGYVPVFEFAMDGQPADAATVHADRLSWLPALVHQLWLRILVAGFALVIVAASIFFLTDRVSLPLPTDETLKMLEFRPVLAVLPFEQRTVGVDEELALGLTEDLATDLASVNLMDVIALTSLDSDRSDVARHGELRSELGVTHVLRGSVRGDSEGVRITAQLVDLQSGIEVWADRFDREPSQLLNLQDEASIRVVEALSLELSDDAITRMTTPGAENPEAQALYRQAINLVNPPNDRVRNEAALLSFNQVIELDPEFAGGYAGVAYVQAFRALFGLSNSGNEVRLAREYAEAAISRSTEFGFAHTALAFASLVEREYTDAIEHSSRAVAVSPNDPYVLIYHGILHGFNGDPRAGIRYARRALRLDPLNERSPYLNILATLHFYAGQYEEALGAIERNVSRGGPLSDGLQLTRASALLRLGDRLGAMQAVSELQDFEGSVTRTLSWHRQVFRSISDRELLAESLTELAELMSDSKV